MSALLPIKRLQTQSANFDAELSKLLAWHEDSDPAIERAVADIVSAVKQRGDEALLEYTERFDQRRVECAKDLIVSKAALDEALSSIPSEQREALHLAAQRIRDYHQHQVQASWSFTEEDGTKLGQKVTPLDRVGLYVPGGKAAYPSSVLMSAIPAKVAGVQEVVMVTPKMGGELNPTVLAAAAIAGVDRVLTVGGAQAVASLAYGTETVPKVDKIVGPGNVYVATAKRQVFGVVDIDMIAGPSEILVLADGKANPDWIAMDLFSQAEHDEMAQAILISPDAAFLDCVQKSIARLLPDMSRAAIIERSLLDRGALIEVKDLEQAITLINHIAPEHLELAVEDPEPLLVQVRHAGAIFMGYHSSESLGDYCAGPNHVLPTSGTARFSSPLGVYDFVKRSSVIYCSARGASDLGKIASVLATSESLEAHARSAEYRLLKSD